MEVQPRKRLCLSLRRPAPDAVETTTSVTTTTTTTTTSVKARATSRNLPASLSKAKVLPETSSQSSPAASPNRPHNKSGKERLSLMEYTPEQRLHFRSVLKERLKEGSSVEGLLSTPCLLLKAADGRLTVERKKVAWGYQIAALDVFPTTVMDTIAASKTAEDATLSHLCGTRNCCSALHLYIESKRTNEERIHCHFVLFNILAKSGRGRLEEFLAMYGSEICPHYPQCGSPRPESLISPEVSQQFEEEEGEEEENDDDDFQ